MGFQIFELELLHFESGLDLELGIVGQEKDFLFREMASNVHIAGGFSTPGDTVYDDILPPFETFEDLFLFRGYAG